MQLKAQGGITLVDDRGVIGHPEFFIPYYVGRAVLAFSEKRRIDGIRFTREWYRHANKEPLGLREAKGICDYILANPALVADS